MHGTHCICRVDISSTDSQGSSRSEAFVPMRRSMPSISCIFMFFQIWPFYQVFFFWNVEKQAYSRVCEHVRQLKEVTVVQTTNFQILDMITSVCLKLIHGTQKNIGPLSCPLHSAFSTSSACMQWRSCVCFRNHPSTDLLAFCNSGLEEDDDSCGLDLQDALWWTAVSNHCCHQSIFLLLFQMLW